jgi:predicted nucleic acid-binding protein
VPQKKPSKPRKSRERFLLDAGPIIGLFNQDDDWHKRCFSFFAELDFELIITEAVISEVIYKIQKEKRKNKAVEAVTTLLDDIEKDRYKVHFLKKNDFQRIKALRIKYADQNRLDYADLTLVIAAEDLNLNNIITIDKNDFEKLQWNNKHHFNVIQPDIKAFRKL